MHGNVKIFLRIVHVVMSRVYTHEESLSCSIKKFLDITRGDIRRKA
jgi:hypothetical protein